MFEWSASPWDRTLASVFVEACLYLPFGMLGLRKIRLEALLARGTDASSRHRVRLADSKYAHETLSQSRSGQSSGRNYYKFITGQVHGHLTDWRRTLGFARSPETLRAYRCCGLRGRNDWMGCRR
jgi:hypothetical protein